MMLRAAFFFILLLLPSVGHAEKRVALVVGNSVYKHAGELTNPKNDAADMAFALRKLGFQVIDGLDLDKAAFDRKIRDFAAALSNAAAGVFFYAGHGLQVSGKNYLVPVDAELTTAEALEFEMVQVDVVHRIMESKTSTNVLFLDACRNNPLARNLARAMGTRSAAIGPGLAPVEAGVGTLISFSTQPGNVALDGRGRNSPFAGALIRHISTSADSLGDLLIAVRNDVRRETDGKQVPWEHSALTGRFYFNAAALPAQPSAVPQPVESEAAREWSRVDKTSIAELETFLTRHATSPQADYARARVQELKQQQKTALSPPLSPPTKESEQCVAKGGRGTAGSEDGAKYHAWVAILQATDRESWASFTKLGMKVGSAPGYKVSNMRMSCKAGGSLGQECIITATLCK